MFAWAAPYLLWIKVALAVALAAISFYGGWRVSSWRAAAELQEQKDAAAEGLRKANSNEADKAGRAQARIDTLQSTIATLRVARKTDAQRAADNLAAAKLGIVGGACMAPDRLLDLSRAIDAANTAGRADGTVSAPAEAGGR